MAGMLKNFFWPLLALAILSGCSGGSGAGAVDACVARGVQYFKDVGSYPTLRSEPNAGRPAEDVAKERCRRTLTAF